jgi:cathepsin B
MTWYDEIGMMAYEDFLTYESGVYTVTTTQEAGGHAVRLVGWGTSDEGVDYWILINQWSEDWGMSGTAYIRRGTNEALVYYHTLIHSFILIHSF